jgi:outer membrane protein OmpA-like peptidoglycan-associated protein
VFRRAAAVRDYLVAHGVAPARVSVEDQGFEHPLIPTKLGQPEPANRMVRLLYRAD